MTEYITTSEVSSYEIMAHYSVYCNGYIIVEDDCLALMDSDIEPLSPFQRALLKLYNEIHEGDPASFEDTFEFLMKMELHAIPDDLDIESEDYGDPYYWNLRYDSEYDLLSWQYNGRADELGGFPPSDDMTAALNNPVYRGSFDGKKFYAGEPDSWEMFDLEIRRGRRKRFMRENGGIQLTLGY